MKVYHLQQDSLPDIQIDVTKRGLQRFRYKETNKHVFSSFTSVPTHDRIQFLCSKLCSVSASPRHKVYSSQHISVPPPTHLAVSVHSPLIYLPWMITWASSLLSFFPHFLLHWPLFTPFSEKDPSTVFQDTRELCCWEWHMLIFHDVLSAFPLMCKMKITSIFKHGCFYSPSLCSCCPLPKLPHTSCSNVLLAGKIPLCFAHVLTHHKAGLVFPVTHPSLDCFDELFTSAFSIHTCHPRLAPALIWPR